MSFRRVSRVLLELTVCLQSSIVHFWRKSRFIPCEIGLYDGILEFGKTHFSLEFSVSKVAAFFFPTCDVNRSCYMDLKENIFGRTIYPRSFVVIAFILAQLRRRTLCARPHPPLQAEAPQKNSQAKYVYLSLGRVGR